MSTNIVYNGVTYTIPATDDVAWGDAVSAFLIAIPSGMLTKVGGPWALTGSDLDLGAAYGISSIYLKTKTATPALAGVLRLAFADAIAWRASANNKDLVLKPNASNLLTWDAIALVDVSTAQTISNKTINAPDNTITNIKDVNVAPDAAIAYSKILVTAAEIPWTTIDSVGKIKNADIAADASIDGSKVNGNFGPTEIITAGGVSLGTTFHVTLIADPSEDYDFQFPDADGITGQALVKSALGQLEWASIPGLALSEYNVLVGDSSNLPAPVNTNTTGDIAATSAAGFTIKALAITDAMINATAAIAFSKMAALTASRAVVSDASGFVVSATTTAAEIGYVNGVTSAIQTQLGTKVVGPASAVDSNFASFDTTTGKLIKDSGAKAADFATAGSITNKVVGPASAVDSNFASFDTTTGKLIKDSGAKIADFATASSVSSLLAIPTATLEPTGFEDNANVGVAYSSAAQTITLTHSSGTIWYWVNGVRLSLASPWTSTAHTNTVDHKYWLSISGAGASVWTTDASPGFDKCLVANCIYYTAYKFAIREVHGLMQHQTHKELHNTVGTYYGSGGSAVAASYAALTNTIAAVTPDVDAAVINDEDLPSSITAFAAADGYTQLYFNTNAATFVTGAALPYIVTGTASAGNPRYNANPVSGTALADITTNNRWFNVYTIFVPVTSDAGSQAYRMLWLTGQQVYTTLTAAQSEDFRTLALGNLITIFGEVLPYIRWSFIKTNSNNTYNTQVAAIPTYLLGTAASLISVSGFNPADHNALTGRSDADSHPSTAITGTAVTLAGAEVVTNKDIDGGTASNTNRITVPGNTKANLDGLTRKEGTVVYATDLDTLFADNGSALVPVGSSTGNGEKNYITNPSMSLATTGWNVVGYLNLTRSVTAAELPREFTTATGIKITATAGTQSVADYVYYDFSLDDVDLSKKLKIQWSQKLFGAYTAGLFAVVITSQADRTTVLHTPVTTLIPGADGVFTTSFDASTTAALSLVIRPVGDMGTDIGLVISDVVVGPGSIVTGAVVGEWVSYVPVWASTITNPAIGSGTVTGKYRRVGDSAEIIIDILTAANTTYGNSSHYMSMPSGLTVDTTKLTNVTSVLGTGRYALSATNNQYDGIVTNSTSTQLAVVKTGGVSGSYVGASDFTASTAGQGIYIHAMVPIAEWAGSGTVNLAQNDVEYAFNTSGRTTAGTDNIAFGYGPIGAAIGDIDSATNTGFSLTNMYVKFQSPIQVGDSLVLELDVGTSGARWVSAAQAGMVPIIQKAACFGVQLRTIDSTTVNVSFGNAGYAASGTNYGDAGGAWTGIGTWRWRVCKTSAGQAKGFGIATAGQSGLINYYEEGTFSATFNQGMYTGSTGNTVTVSFVRVGKMVSLYFPIFRVTANVTALSTGCAASTLPARLIPSTYMWLGCGGVYDTNQEQGGYFYIGSDGSIAAYKYNKANFTSGTTNCGFGVSVVSYMLP
jgi:hypothetical protein